MISRELVLELLRQKQDSFGGYSGDDIIEIAAILEVTPRGLRRRLNNWINSDILKEVSTYIRCSNPSWFKEHDELFKRQTDGLFWIEYTEEEFAKRLYNSIGFLGRNFRYRDSDEFFCLKYFIQRYISDATLKLELRFIHQCIEKLYDYGDRRTDEMGFKRV